MVSKVARFIFITACLGLFSVIPVRAKIVNLAWDPSPSTNIQGYRVYYQAGSSSLSFDGNGANEGASPIDVGKVLALSVNGLPDAQIHSFTVTAYDASGNESSYSNIVISPPIVAIPNPVLWDSIQDSYMTIQRVYDNIPSGQTDTIKVKAGEQAPENLYFDRDVIVRVQGGYDDMFTNVISGTSFYGTLTVASGSATLSNLIIK